MKKPDEIKKALECCFYDSAQCGECPYYPVSCDRELVRDAREYIRRLESCISEWEDVAASPVAVEDMARANDWLHRQIDQMAKHIQRLEAERDAAINDIMHTCATCKHYFFNKDDGSDCEYDCLDGPDGCHNGNTRWEWCGVQKEE